MNAISIPVIIMSGISAYVGLYHLILYLKKRDSKDSLFFALICIAVACYDVMCAGLYNSDSILEGPKWQKGQYFCSVSIAIGFINFIYYLIYRKNDWIKIMTNSILVLLIISGILFGDLISSNIQMVRKLAVLNTDVAYYEAKPGLLMNILYIILFAEMVYIYSLLVSYVRLQKKKNLFLPVLIGVAAFFVSSIADILIAENIIQFIYTAEYAFLILILMMDYTLLQRFVQAFDEIENVNVMLEEMVAVRTERIQRQADELFDMNKALEENNRKLIELAERDSLTKLLNHAAFHRRLSELFSVSKRQSFPISVIMIDIDYFKKINDTYGHPAGDQVLLRVAGVLSTTSKNYDIDSNFERKGNENNLRSIRNYDIAGRYGGDEFAVILPYCGEKECKVVAERIVNNVKMINFDTYPGLQITSSLGCGILALPSICENEKELVELADCALYAAKEKGRNRSMALVYNG